jgi:hypothetical protein
MKARRCAAFALCVTLAKKLDPARCLFGVSGFTVRWGRASCALCFAGDRYLVPSPSACSIAARNCSVIALPRKRSPAMSSQSCWPLRRSMVSSASRAVRAGPSKPSAVWMGPATQAFDAVLYFTQDRDLGFMYQTDGNPAGEIVPLTGSDLFELRD